MKKLFALIFFLCVLTFSASSEDLLNFVTDTEHIFTVNEIEQLNNALNEHQLQTNTEIDVITTESVAPYSHIHDYAKKLSQSWLTVSGSDDFLLLIISKKLGLIKIVTSYHTEKLISNEVCKDIIQRVMIPEFSQEKYFEGTLHGINSLSKSWR